MNKPLFSKIESSVKSLLIVLFCFAALTAYAQGGRISVNRSNVPLSQVMTDIQTQSGYIFLNKDVDVTGLVSLQVTDASLNDALNRLFAPIGVDCIVEGTNIIISRKAVADSNAPVTITGVVTDSDNQPVAGAAVIVKGTTLGTTTGLDGRYTLQVPPPDIWQVPEC